MDLKKIKSILADYFEGKAGREEEELLKQFFSGNDVPPEMKADKMMFMSLKEASSVEIPDSKFDKKVMAAISAREIALASGRRRRLVYTISGIAASVLLLAGSYLFLFERQVQEFVMSDEHYTEQEMMLAYEEAKNALLLVSSVMNTATGELAPLVKISEAKRELEAIHRFHQGASGLRVLSVFDETVSVLRPDEK